MRITLIEDASDRMQLSDLKQFARGDRETLAPIVEGGGRRGGPGGGRAAPPEPPAPEPVLLDVSRVSEKSVTSASNEQVCGRDDKGQEPTMDVDAALTMAPSATIQVRYDEVCLRGGEGTLEIQRALDDTPSPDVIVFPFAVAPLYEGFEATFGPTPIVYLEAELRGIPVVVPSGDDGALGIRVYGTNKAAVVYPCVLLARDLRGRDVARRARGTLRRRSVERRNARLGRRHLARNAAALAGSADGLRACAHDVEARMAPDVSADAAGHLYVFWHGYGEGGVGGTSESAAMVGAQLAAIDAALPRREPAACARRSLRAGARPSRRVPRRHEANDRGYVDNTLHPRNLAPPLGFMGVVPSPPPTGTGCATFDPTVTSRRVTTGHRTRLAPRDRPRSGRCQSA